MKLSYYVIVILLLATFQHVVGGAPKNNTSKNKAVSNAKKLLGIPDVLDKLLKDIEKKLTTRTFVRKPIFVVYEFPGNAFTKYFPILVKRCANYTNGVRRLFASNKTTTTVVVDVQTKKSDGQVVAEKRNETIEVVTKCVMKPKVKKGQCKHPQEYIVNDANCGCNRELIDKCNSNHDKNKHFNSDTCRCECNHTRKCTSSQTFNTDCCECILKKCGESIQSQLS